MIRTIEKSDEVSVVNVIVQAFSTDPVARWVLTGDQEYFTHFPVFVRAFGGAAFKNSSVYFVDGYAGAALWLGTGVYPDREAMISLFQRVLGEQIRKQIFSIFEQMGRYHPSGPHWYLPLIGLATK